MSIRISHYAEFNGDIPIELFQLSKSGIIINYNSKNFLKSELSYRLKNLEKYLVVFIDTTDDNMLVYVDEIISICKLNGFNLIDVISDCIIFKIKENDSNNIIEKNLIKTNSKGNIYLEQWNDAQEIITGIYLGSYFSALDDEWLDKKKDNSYY